MGIARWREAIEVFWKVDVQIQIATASDTEMRDAERFNATASTGTFAYIPPYDAVIVWWENSRPMRPGPPY